MSALAQALLAFQKSAPAIQKDAINPHFGNRFPSLEGLMSAVVPQLNECGLIVTQLPTAILVDGRPSPALRTRITHAESGEHLEDVMLLMGKEDPQGQGSAITYARRYSLMAMLGLVADEDDDGNKASMTINPKPSSGAGMATAASPAPGNPVEAARLAQEAIQESKTSPSSMIVHFGKNKGTPLNVLSDRQLEWYATQWTLQEDPSEYDHALKAAAIATLTQRQGLRDLPFE
jgi:hypothetical protein